MKWGESFEPVTLYARYLCSRNALGLKAYIAQSVGTHYSGCQLFRSVYPMQPAGQARRATIGYLVYNLLHRGVQTVLQCNTCVWNAITRCRLNMQWYNTRTIALQDLLHFNYVCTPL